MGEQQLLMISNTTQKPLTKNSTGEFVDIWWVSTYQGSVDWQGHIPTVSIMPLLGTAWCTWSPQSEVGGCEPQLQG